VSQFGILLMRLLAPLPLPLLRAFGALLGVVLYLLVVPRRRVVRRNLALCFPRWTTWHREAVSLRVFVRVAQAWLDRSWIWHAAPEVVRRRMKLVGATEEFEGQQPTLIFAPHFVGMDAGWSALTQQVQRQFVGIYTRQSNPTVDAWLLRGRHRFGACRPFGRADGVRELVSALKRGEVMYLLPDMNFGPQESIFVPFYGVPAATVPSLSRFARLGRAKVVPVVTRLTRGGYEVRVLPAWADFPTPDVTADTALMNRRLEAYIDPMPEQYYWVHKRFKSRPPGQPSVY